MTRSDVQFIEHELGITLPESYLHAVMPFRIPAMAGNTDSQLWDDAQCIINLNQELRNGSRFRPAWPTHLFALGDPHGDELIALDVRTHDGPVWWFDHGVVDSDSSYQTHPRFADWADEFYRNIRSDLAGDGYDPEGTPEALNAAQSKSARHEFFGCIAVVIVIALAIVACIFLHR
jgi:SMI1 / KNR4 family (SUKH-1)